MLCKKTITTGFWLLLSLLTSQNLAAISSPPLVISDEMLRQQDPIGKYVITASDDKAEMTPAGIMRGDFDARFTAHGDKKTISYGYNRRWPHWGYFAVTNPDSTAKKLYLEAGYSAIDQVSFMKVSPSGEVISQTILGDKLPFTDRPIAYRHPIFEMHLDPGVNYFLVKVDTTSGVVFDFTLYDETLIKNAKLKELIIVGLLLGGILTIFLYNLFLFVTTRDSNYGLYIIYVASYFFFAMAYFGILPYIMFSTWADAPLTGWDLYLMVDGISVGSGLFAIGFLSLKRESPFFYRFVMVLVGICALNALSNLLFLHGRFHQLLSLSIAMSFFSGICLVAVGVRMCIKGYAPAVYYTIAWSFVIVGNCMVILSGVGILERNFITNWSQLIGANVEMILLSFALGARINLIKSQKLKAERQMLRDAEEKKQLQASLIATQEDNIRTLDGKVRERTRDIREILANINQGIFTFREDMKLGAEISDHLLKMIGRSNLTGQNLSEAIFSHTNLSANQVSQVITSLEFSFGQDIDMGWEANKSRLVREFQLQDQGRTLHIEAEWGAITNEDGEVDKVLVALRDITELKELRAKAQRNELETAMLLEILANDIEKTQKFISRTIHAWREIDPNLKRLATEKDLAYPILFRTYHTIKGNARSLGFARIADSVHDVESLLKDAGTDPRGEKLEKLVAASNACREFVESYETIFNEKFSKFFNQKSTPKGRRLEEFFADLVAPSLEKVAKDTGKPVPQVVINNPNGFMILNDEIEDIAQNIFHHLIRNSVDHGLENAEDRKRLGKRPFGEITIDVSIDSNKNASVIFRDDGRGLNLSRVYQVGLEKGILSESATVDDMVEAIFQLGFSTARKTTLISGRGIGMDAVRHYCRSLGGKFRVVLDHEVDEVMLKRIKSKTEHDVHATFSFRSEFNLRLPVASHEQAPTAKLA
ncbi:MAG TPA: 7TM diverse intracellular signaling domain-containing protein [Oligoflexus sp.]|uniref:7TM diverse intracellular signaling domain-containing protein n=1 Tax=Oligoflexus sp. TaxID=1971216 RepID=UPI002D65AC71|nr:7TM diverse intracellular signaling domain-containing protein [Oligoflexus sp.]HYX34460.1 7TM diverse intracellular signaling domain-containing protein [Oligoflexus sp.]